MRRTALPLLLLLLASLALAGIAHGDALDPNVPGVPNVTLPVETELIGGDEEEDEEGEWDEEEGEEEDEEWESWEAGGEPPVGCLLRSASAKAVVPTGAGKLRLTIAYTTFEPTATVVNSWLQGGRGSVRLSPAPAHLGDSGTLHLTEDLTAAEAARASAAREFTVRLRIPAAPRECRPLFTRQLQLKHASRNHASWRQSGSIFGGDP
jgi:hypothetical protein